MLIGRQVLEVRVDRTSGSSCLDARFVRLKLIGRQAQDDGTSGPSE